MTSTRSWWPREGPRHLPDEVTGHHDVHRRRGLQCCQGVRVQAPQELQGVLRGPEGQFKAMVEWAVVQGEHLLATGVDPWAQSQDPVGLLQKSPYESLPGQLLCPCFGKQGIIRHWHLVRLEDHLFRHLPRKCQLHEGLGGPTVGLRVYGLLHQGVLHLLAPPQAMVGTRVGYLK